MIRTMRWVPDTHPEVEIELQWDDADPSAAHVCLEYRVNGVPVADPEGAYHATVSENKAKNTAIKTLEDHPGGPIMAEWKRDHEGALTIVVQAEDKEKARTALSGILPPGMKVE